MRPRGRTSSTFCGTIEPSVLISTEKMEKGVSPLPVTRTIRLHVFEAVAALSR